MFQPWSSVETSFPNRNISFDYRSLKGILPGSPYPMSELCVARDEFSRLWQLALARNPVARKVASLHYNHPPNIRMRHVMEYPFLHENAKLRNMPALPASISQALKRAHEQGRSNPCQAQSQRTETSAKRRCLSPAADREDTDASQPSLFICDHCLFEAHHRPSLLDHLEQRRHATGSEYKVQGTASSDDDSDHGSERRIVLVGPRTVTVTPRPVAVCSAGDMVVICPVCYLIFPDKIACAYHHCIQHTNYQNKYTFGTVLAARTVSMYNQSVCCNCRQHFAEHRDLVAHWFDGSKRCISPFLPVFTKEEASYAGGDSMYPLVFNVQCDTCGLCLDRTFPVAPSLADYGCDDKTTGKTSAVSRAYGKRVDPDWLRKRVDGFGRFCMNHAHLHVRNVRNATCHLKLRFVHVHKIHPETLPTCHLESDSAIMGFSLPECERLVAYLKTHYKSRKALVKSADSHLRALMDQKLLRQQQSSRN